MRSYRSLKTELSTKFKESVDKNNFNEFLKASKTLLSSWKENDFKNIVELTIREVLLDLIKTGANITFLERVFQFSIDAAIHDAVAGNAPVLVIGDMFESSTIAECEKYFSFVESRVEVFKKDIFFKACKNHLLRSCNDLLKRLSRSQNTVFCGRILMFLAHIFPLSERSGLNIISEFNLENTTAYSTKDDSFSDLVSEKSDGAEEGEISSQSHSPVTIDKNLYQKFWSLQDFFRSPNTCYNKMQWRQFASCTSEILTVFGSFKSDDAKLSKWKQAKLPSPDGSSVYFAKYLTSPKLLELELSDSHFRRYVLVQFLILFQYLTLPVKFKLESYILTEEQQNWLKETTKNIYKLLEETPPNGETFAQDVEKILQREEYWNAWKNEGCPDFKPLSDKAEIEKRIKKRPGDDLHAYPNKKINAEAIKLWNTKPNNWEACRSAKRNFVPTLESYFQITSEGEESPKRDMTDSKYTWKALRLLCMKSPHIFTANTAPAKGVSEYLESIIQKLAKEKPQSQQDSATVETGITEDESMEDANDEFLPASEEDSKEEVKKENILTKALIEIISEKLQDNWQAIALKLGFQEDEVEYFETSFPDAKLQTEQMLTVWMEQDGSLPTFTKILQSTGSLNTVLSILSS
ncbi:THO complex subunit 1 [Trichonephila inaurata madagascariensis]|uniref:THO complex subunit 1 n=1 Tax=Trichonephila inaurata madagascariensis TaxID=2747483 RepID=A0A8X7C3G0_9ARAC|nr:THO complex subunit 1 [Trichonephila inaurata madagascariensis]